MKKLVGFVGIVLLVVAIVLCVIKVKLDKSSDLINRIAQPNEGDIVFGDSDVNKSLIVYFDYNCRLCRKFILTSYEQLNEKYIKTGQLKLVLRLVCSKADMQAIDAYQTAICYSRYSNYQKFHELLMHQSNVIYTEEYRQLRDDLVHNNEDIAECILGTDNRDIKHNIKQLFQLKTKGTPTFIINDKVVVGYKGYEVIEELLNDEYVLN